MQKILVIDELGDGQESNQNRSHVAQSIAAANGIGNMGIVLQVIMRYPIIGLIVLNIAKAKYRLAPQQITTG